MHIVAVPAQVLQFTLQPPQVCALGFENVPALHLHWPADRVLPTAQLRHFELVAPLHVTQLALHTVQLVALLLGK